MKGKTKVLLKINLKQSKLIIGTKGYIDGYIEGNGSIPSAFVVFNNKIEMVKINNLQPLTDQNNGKIIKIIKEFFESLLVLFKQILGIEEK